MSGGFGAEVAAGVERAAVFEEAMESVQALAVARPRRIQRKRTKGWRMPEGAVYVGRPTKFGNPFKAGEWAEWTDGEGGWMSGFTATGDEAASDFARVLAGEIHAEGFSLTVEEIRTELEGRDLACWCPLDEPCHADVLLELANGSR